MPVPFMCSISHGCMLANNTRKNAHAHRAAPTACLAKQVPPPPATCLKDAWAAGWTPSKSCTAAEMAAFEQFGRDMRSNITAAMRPKASFCDRRVACCLASLTCPQLSSTHNYRRRSATASLTSTTCPTHTWPWVLSGVVQPVPVTYVRMPHMPDPTLTYPHLSNTTAHLELCLCAEVRVELTN